MTQKQLTHIVNHPSPQSDLTVRAGLAAASAWSLFLLVMSVLWGLGIVASPLAGSEEWTFTSMIAALPGPFAGLIIGSVSLLSFVGSAALLTATRLRQRLFDRGGARVLGVVVLAFAAVVTVMLTDTLLLAYLGYALSLQFPPIPAPVIWQGVMLLGPLLWIIVWAGAEKTSRRIHEDSHRHSTETVHVEDSAAGHRRADVDGTGRVGRSTSVTASAKIAVVVAVIVPGFYALTRVLWAVGIPFGLSEGLYDEGQRVGLWHSGLALALAAIGGILLTLGLIQRWGERLPTWLGPLGGKRVPITLATIPATIVSLAIFTGGVGLVRTIFSGTPEIFADSWWVTIGPTLLFPLWAVALGWATFAYRERRLAAEAGASGDV
ncbi:hypothetical protein GCM10010974_09910 [Brevibacterium sediminis]|uniref:DUF3995 domain-containing protein n=1 Tax=Brevibacterium sediminis TaxID=1857024 RepID=A0A5C4X315_9MICO|nr:hypothetical protein [Brevibacterium sediminis]TNM55947.1 hypothetical protein FHQ09_06865 [Brevibacterium sediminis]GGC29343.1 hypothetical protein GCM10010974_09910 [Brevibacterium sediminis]